MAEGSSVSTGAWNIDLLDINLNGEPGWYQTNILYSYYVVAVCRPTTGSVNVTTTQPYIYIPDPAVTDWCDDLREAAGLTALAGGQDGVYVTATYTASVRNCTSYTGSSSCDMSVDSAQVEVFEDTELSIDGGIIKCAPLLSQAVTCLDDHYDIQADWEFSSWIGRNPLDGALVDIQWYGASNMQTAKVGCPLTNSAVCMSYCRGIYPNPVPGSITGLSQSCPVSLVQNTTTVYNMTFRNYGAIGPLSSDHWNARSSWQSSPFTIPAAPVEAVAVVSVANCQMPATAPCVLDCQQTVGVNLTLLTPRSQPCSYGSVVLLGPTVIKGNATCASLVVTSPSTGQWVNVSYANEGQLWQLNGHYESCTEFYGASTCNFTFLNRTFKELFAAVLVCSFLVLMCICKGYVNRVQRDLSAPHNEVFASQSHVHES